MNIIVRLETERDYRLVEEVTRCAFAYRERIERGQIGCPYEHWMVHELRKGVGKALITGMLDRAKQLGHGAILFFGRPEYYPQFGFQEASVFGITDSEGYNYPSFMGMELVPGYLEPAYGGKYYESDIYNDELNREAVKEFDKDF